MHHASCFLVGALLELGVACVVSGGGVSLCGRMEGGARILAGKGECFCGHDGCVSTEVRKRNYSVHDQEHHTRHVPGNMSF